MPPRNDFQKGTRLDFWYGLGAGIIGAVVIGAIALFLFLRDTNPVSVPAPVSSKVPASVTVMMVESFLNAQLRDALMSEAVELEDETIRATQARVPLKIKLNDAALDIQPGRTAEFTSQMTASAWGLNLELRPVTEFHFVPQKGRVKIVVTRVRVRGFTVPRTLIDHFVNEVVETAEEKLNHSLTQLEHDTNVTLADIETTDELLILKFG
jgi:hypothetical protein